MKLYSDVIKNKAIDLREKGYSSKEINDTLGLKIPKSTYSGWFKRLILSPEAKIRLANDISNKLNKARILAVATNKEIRKKFLNSLDNGNLERSKKIKNIDSAKIALSMLCLGEASKHKNGSAFCLGNTDHRIITLFIKLLDKCYKLDWSKFRCTVMCRADQDVPRLEKYWQEITGISRTQFYKARIDKRSEGKKTLRLDYMGVLKVDYLDTKIQLDLESLADLIYNQIK